MHTIKFQKKRQNSIFNRYGEIDLPTFDTQEVAVANLSDALGRPLIRNWISPAIAMLSPDLDQVRDKGQPEVYWSASPDGQIVQINSPSKFLLDGGMILTAGSDAPQSKDSFTFIAKVNGAGVLLSTERSSISSTGSVAIGASGILTAAGGAGVNSADNAGDLSGIDVLVTVCFSVDSGVTIRRNGIETFRDATKTATNLGERLQLFGAGISVSSRFSGECGPVFYSEYDLSKPEYLSQLEEIEQAANVDLG